MRISTRSANRCRVAAGALGDLAQPVVSGVDVDVEPFGGSAGIEIGGDGLAEGGDENTALPHIVVDELPDRSRDEAGRRGVAPQGQVVKRAHPGERDDTGCRVQGQPRQLCLAIGFGN
jgi:hypothetical protein